MELGPPGMNLRLKLPGQQPEYFDLIVGWTGGAVQNKSLVNFKRDHSSLLHSLEHQVVKYREFTNLHKIMMDADHCYRWLSNNVNFGCSNFRAAF